MKFLFQPTKEKETKYGKLCITAGQLSVIMPVPLIEAVPYNTNESG